MLNEKTNCTLEDMMRVLAYSLSVVQYPIVNESEVSQLGLVSILLEVTSCVRAARTYILPEVYISMHLQVNTTFIQPYALHMLVTEHHNVTGMNM